MTTRTMITTISISTMMITSPIVRVALIDICMYIMAISNTFSTGLFIGYDIYNVVLQLRLNLELIFDIADPITCRRKALLLQGFAEENNKPLHPQGLQY